MKWRGIVGALEGGLVASGLLAFLCLAVESGWLAPAGPGAVVVRAAFVPAHAAASLVPPAAAQHRALAEYLAHRYRVDARSTAAFVRHAYKVGRAVGVDPLLLLAVIAVESSFNPIAESDAGAKGLMQVIPRFHPEKLAGHGGAAAVLDPEVDMLVGARILKEYIVRAGSVAAGLQMYSGAPDDPEQDYAQKVIAERERIERAALGRQRRGSADLAAHARPEVPG